jgi:hypothetical protein
MLDATARDDDLRSSCFASLDVLCARYGEDVPYRDGLDQGFPFRGGRVPFLSIQKGIFRAAAQRGPAALAIQTSSKSPYDDEQVDGGFLYAYAPVRSSSPTTAPCELHMLSKLRWSTSSRHGQAGTSRSIPSSSSRTIRPQAACSSPPVG